VTANPAACAADRGCRVGVLDADLQSPGVHVLFGVPTAEIKLTLIDFLWDRCTIEETTYDVSPRVCPGGAGRCWLIAASLTTRAILRLLDEGYDPNRLGSHFDQLIKDLELDLLFIDTHPGLNNETKLTTTVSDVLVLMIRPDQQDYYGSAVVLEVASKLEVPDVYLVANKVYSHVETGGFRARLEDTFNHDVIGILPLSEDLARIESRQLIVNSNPDHAISHTLRDIADRLVSK
jgi:MinD-like ATPase involved in chromosome partitioning or flagellar assembly